MRTVLAIEASNPSACPTRVCVGTLGPGGDAAVLGEHAGDAGRSTDGVMESVRIACERAGVTPREIDAVAVSVGPGGYTALRIATTTAKTLGFSLGRPVICVPTALVAARAIAAEDRPALVALASKGGRAHCTVIGPDGSARDLGVLGAEGLGAGGARVIVADGHLDPALAARAAQLGMARRGLVLSARACLEAAAGIAAVAPDAVRPIYAREPDAVTQWRARHGGGGAG
jgi:tRNA threonylcarbamoyladenosine biosynthesis protein TsaB